MTGTITSIDASDRLEILGETLRPVLTNAMGSAVEVYDTSGPEGCGPPPHRHPWEEIYVVRSGRLEVTVDGGTPFTVEAGGVAHVPGHTVHSYRIAAADTNFLTIFSRGNATPFFAELVSEVTMDPPDIPALVGVAQRHGVEIQG